MNVVINLNSFVTEVFLALSSNNEDDMKELDEKFNHFCKSHKKETVDKSFEFIRSRKIVLENKNLEKYFGKFPM